MNVLLDTNVLLDVFLKREPFFDASSQVLGLAERGKMDGWICGTTVTTIFYLLDKSLSREKARESIKQLLKILDVANINRVVLEDALNNGFKDYEDGVLYQSALHANLEAIITRNQKDFTRSELPVYSPAEFLIALNIIE